MKKNNEAIVQSLIEKQKEEEEKEPEEAPIEFKAGQYDISQEQALLLENLNLRLELLERDKRELEGARRIIITQISKELGVPDNMKIVGGTSDFRKVIVEKMED